MKNIGMVSEKLFQNTLMLDSLTVHTVMYTVL